MSGRGPGGGRTGSAAAGGGGLGLRLVVADRVPFWRIMRRDGRR